MKKRKGALFCAVLYLLTALCIGAAVWLQIAVSGEKLLTMDSAAGRWMAASYRWVTVAAAALTLVSVPVLLARGKRKKAASAAQPAAPEQPAKGSAAPAPQAAPAKPVEAAAPAQPAGERRCPGCGAACAAGQKFCRSCGAKL